MTRFSRQKLINYLDAQLAYIDTTQDFDPNNGTAQLDNCTDINRILDYGKQKFIETLLSELDGGDL